MPESPFTQRAVLVRSDLSADQVSTGSGTVVGPKLVLTAAHVVFGDAGMPLTGVRVGLPGQMFAGRVLWPPSYDPVAGPPERDAALVEITDEGWVPGLGVVLWGRLTGRAPGVACTATGFPRAKIDPDGDGSRDSDQIEARINPGSNLVSGMYDVDVRSPIPVQLRNEPSPWSGASGAGVFARDLLIGVLLSDERHAYSGDRLRAVPVDRLAADDDFRDRLWDGGAGLGSLAEIRSVELEGVLSPAAGSRTRRQQRLSPASLLRPEAETVPFHGREDLLAEFDRWCTAAGIGVDIRLLVGPGGQGKTRFARQLAQRLANGPATGSGRWLTGFLEADPDGAHAADLLRLADTAGPVLAVVDYAETRTEQVTRVMEAVWNADSGSAARVLLVARSTGDWWQRLTDRLDLPTTGVTRLAGLDLEQNKTASLDAAVSSFAFRLTELQPDVDWQQVADRVHRPPDLHHMKYQSPLTLQLAALTALLDAADHRSPGANEPAEEALLRHERSYWSDTASAAGLRLAADTLQDTIAVATLTGANTREEATTVLGVVPGLSGTSADTIGRVSGWLRELYPPTAEQRWGSLQPDRVAEYQAASRLANGSTLLERVLSAASPTQRLQVLTVLARTLVNPTLTGEQTEHLSNQLGGAMRASLGEYGAPAVRVATQAPDPTPLIRAVEGAAEQAALADLTPVANALSEASIALAPLAERIVSRIVTLRRTSMNRRRRFSWLPKRRRQGDIDARAALAGALNNQAIALAALGRREEALDANTEAVTLYRRLSAARPGAFTGDFAGALSNQSVQLSELRRPREALRAITKAVTLRRKLAAADADASTADLVGSLINLSYVLGNLGRHEESLKAISEALTLHRELPAASEDRFAAELARSLSNQSNALAGLDRHEEALEAITKAVNLRRELVADRPDMFTAELAATLNNQAGELVMLERDDDALAATTEAVTLYRPLAAARPDAFAPSLAMSLLNLGNLLAGPFEQYTEAMHAHREAVLLLHDLAARRPTEFTHQLQEAINTLLIDLDDLGYDEDTAQRELRELLGADTETTEGE